jgi:P-type E1-E2 ATPase
MIKDAFEDFKRYKSDKSENEAPANVLSKSDHTFSVAETQKIIVGDIVRVDNDETIPSDILLLHTSDPKGQCFIETKNLDGETNLKIKQTHKDMMPLFMNEAEFKNSVQGNVTCELPNAAIYKFEGTFKHPNLD